MQPRELVTLLESQIPVFSGTGRMFFVNRSGQTGFLLGWGTTVGNSQQGWMPGALFFKLDGANDTVQYVNRGSSASASWVKIADASFNVDADPGDAGAILASSQFSETALTIGAGVESRTLADPTEPGKRLLLSVAVAGGGVAGVVVASAFNARGDTSIALAELGDFALLHSVTVAPATYKWVLVAADGAVTGAEFSEVPVLAHELKVWDALQTNLPATPLTDDLGLIGGTFLTSHWSLRTEDLKAAGATSNKARFQLRVPQNYVTGSTIVLSVTGGMVTTVADTTATVDAQVVNQSNDPAADICATAAQSINDLVAAAKLFSITGTDIKPGDLLDVVLTTAVNDGATGTAVIAELSDIKLLCQKNGN